MNNLVAWEIVCKSKVQGGLGVVSLGELNCALLCKWLWRMVDVKDSLWKQWMESVYYNGQFTLGASVHSQSSSVWKAIMKQQEIFNVGLKWNVGDGRKILFWHNKWICDIALKNLYPDLFLISSNQNAKVADLYIHKESEFKWNRNFNKMLEGDSLIQYFKIIGLLDQVSLEDDLDEAERLFDSRKEFKVSSIYRLMNFGGRKIKYHKTLWKAHAPPKIRMHVAGYQQEVKY